MIEAVSCGGVVIFRGKILVLYKHFYNKYEGWVLPKGTMEEEESYADTALREVYEETGVQASIMKYIGKSQYTFNVPEDTVSKEVHYKYHEAYHLLKFPNEKQILEQAHGIYLEMKRKDLWFKS